MRVVSWLVLPLFASSLGAQSAIPVREPPSAEVNAVFKTYAGTDSPGCALGVIHNGRLVYAHGYGMADLERGIRVTPQTVFDIGSTSKQFTAMAVLLLADAGRISLDDDVRKYIPELPDYGATITIRNLLQHTSGLRDYYGLLRLSGVQMEEVSGDEDALRVLVRQKELNFPPGKNQLYSNSGYFLSSLIIKRATGKSLREFARERMFAPLGMNNTRYLDDHAEIVPNRAIGYSAKPHGGFQIDMSNWEQTGDGAVQTSIEDLARWDENFYSAKIGGKAIREMTTPGVVNGEKLVYGLGLFVDEYRGLLRVQHGGDWAGYQAQLLRFPAAHFSVAVLCNVAAIGAEELADRVANVYLSDAFAKEPAPQSPHAAANNLPGAHVVPEYTGLYWSSDFEAFRRISFRDGKLWAGIVGLGPESELVPAGVEEFRVAESPVRLTFERSGGSVRIIKRDGIWPSGVYAKVPQAHPTSQELRNYAGAFYSDELGVTWHLEVNDEQLVLRRPKNFSEPLQPGTADIFTSNGRVFQFTRDANGRVEGFRVSAFRVRHLRFAKVISSAEPRPDK